MSQPIKEAREHVLAAQQAVNHLLSAPQYNQNLLGINAQFKLILNKLSFMGDTLEPSGVSDRAAITEGKRFGPITQFMGEDVRTAQRLTKEQLTPDEDRKKMFLAKVDRLWDDLPKLSAHSILNSYTIEEDRTVLRGVAKRAGVKDFKDREINESFIEDIRIGIGIRNEEAAQQAEIDKRLAIQDAKRAGLADDFEPIVKILTEEDLEADPSLMTELGAEVGDQLEINEDGKFLTKAELLPDDEDRLLDTVNVTRPAEEIRHVDRILTKELIAADPDLRKMKARPGDVLWFDANGQKQIRKP